MTDPVAPFAPETSVADLAAARVVKRVIEQWWLIALCALAAATAAYFVSHGRVKKYESTATIQIGTVDLLNIFLAQDVSVQNADPDRDTAAAIAQFNLPDVRDRAARALNRTVTSQQIADELTITQVAGSSVLKVTARDTDAGRARLIANAMTNAFIAQRIGQARNKLIEAKTQVMDQYNNLSARDKASTTGQLLQDRLKQVGVVGALSNGNVDIIQGARTPSSPVSPRPKRDAFVGLLAGLILGAGIALLRARLDDRVRDTEELSSIWDLPVVGLVPQTSGLRESGRALPDPAALEALSLARTNLRYLHVGGTVTTVVVTSALASEGKSTITWNLAIASALAKSRVLVIEADLRRPKITSRLGLSGSGFSEVLAGLASVDDAISTIQVSGDVEGNSPSIDVLPAGLVPPSPVALLEGPETKSVLAELRERYDIILIDTPPATVVADTLAMMDEVDGVLIVSRLGTVRRGSVRRLKDILTAVNAPVLGQIVNSDSAAKGYGYYASYTERTRKLARRKKAVPAR